MSKIPCEKDQFLVVLVIIRVKSLVTIWFTVAYRVKAKQVNVVIWSKNDLNIVLPDETF